MTIRVIENPKQTGDVHYRQPKATRTYKVTGTSVKLEAQLAIANESPRFENSIDSAGATILIFRNNIAVTEMGAGVWNGVVQYEASPDTIDLNFVFGVQSTKIFQSLSTIRSYSCVSAVSAATTTAVGTANTAITTAEAAVADIAANILDANAAVVAAIALAGVGGVDPAVALLVLEATTATTLTSGYASSAAVYFTEALFQADRAVGAAEIGDTTTAASALALAQAAYANVAAELLVASALTSSLLAATKAAAATTAAGGGNAQTLAAAAGAEVAADEADNVSDALGTANTTTSTALTAAAAAVTAADADQDPGGNGVPNFRGAIGVNGNEVEGTEIEVGAVEFSITKRWKLAVVPASYFVTLSEFTSRSPVNDDDYSIYWMGQTLTFPEGSLRFRGASIKQNSDAEVEITYQFAYSRGILAADGYHVGNSALITKEGHEYAWIMFRRAEDQSQTIARPQALIVEKVYPKLPFGTLEL